MITLTVPDMSCGHCKASVETALTALDPKAAVSVDLAARRVRVTSSSPAEAMIAALARVGFPATAV